MRRGGLRRNVGGTAHPTARGAHREPLPRCPPRRPAPRADRPSGPDRLVALAARRRRNAAAPARRRAYTGSSRSPPGSPGRRRSDVHAIGRPVRAGPRARRGRRGPRARPPPALHRHCSSAATPASARPRWSPASATAPASTASRCSTGHCLDIDNGVPLQPVREALRGAVAGRPADGLAAGDQAAGRLPARSDARRAGSPAALEDLGLVVGELAAESPLMVVLEDMHWADRSTQDFAVALSRTMQGAGLPGADLPQRRADPSSPLPACARSRSAAASAPGASTCRPSDRDGIAGIVERAPGRRDAALVGSLLARSEGNPLYAEELLQAGTDGSPGPLSDLLLARVDALSGPDPRPAAAGLGRRQPPGPPLLAEVDRARRRRPRRLPARGRSTPTSCAPPATTSTSGTDSSARPSTTTCCRANAPARTPGWPPPCSGASATTPALAELGLAGLPLVRRPRPARRLPRVRAGRAGGPHVRRARGRRRTSTGRSGSTTRYPTTTRGQPRQGRPASDCWRRPARSTGSIDRALQLMREALSPASTTTPTGCSPAGSTRRTRRSATSSTGTSGTTRPSSGPIAYADGPAVGGARDGAVDDGDVAPRYRVVRRVPGVRRPGPRVCPRSAPVLASRTLTAPGLGVLRAREDRRGADDLRRGGLASARRGGAVADAMEAELCAA